jgi:hypothetical protein
MSSFVTARILADEFEVSQSGQAEPCVSLLHGYNDCIYPQCNVHIFPSNIYKKNELKNVIINTTGLSSNIL